MELKPLVKHVLSKELQLYYEKITEALLSLDDDLRGAALESISEDNGLQQLLPYFIQFITDQITENLKNLRTIQSMLLTIEAIIKNQYFFIEPYVWWLHQIKMFYLASSIDAANSVMFGGEENLRISKRESLECSRIRRQAVGQNLS